MGGVGQNLPQTQILPGGNLPGGLHGLGPDAPGRVVHHPQQAEVVAGVVDDAEVGQHILDLGALEEAEAPHHPVGDAVALEGHFHLVGQGVHAVEDGAVLPLLALPVGPEELGGDVHALVPLVGGGVALDLVAVAVVGPQVLTLSPPVVADDSVGGLQDVAGGAVVLLQADDPGVLVLTLEGEDIFNGGTPEAVDGLVVVTHHADILPAPSQQPGQQVLEVVGVLVLVDEDVAEFPLVVLPHVGVLLEEPDRVEDDIVKVQRPRRPELFLIGQVDVGDLLQAEITLGLALLHKFRSQKHLVLGSGDIAQDRAGREGLIVHIQLLQALLDDPDRVVGVVDGEGGREAQLLDIPAEDAHAGRVEGGRPDVVCVGANGRFQPLFQLPGGLVGKGDGDDLPGHGGLQGAEKSGPALVLLGGVQIFGILGQELEVGVGHIVGNLPAVGPSAVLQQVGDAVNKHRGLAAAGAGQQEEGTLGGEDTFQLAGVQIAEFPGDHAAAKGREGSLVLLRKHKFTMSFFLGPV